MENPVDCILFLSRKSFRKFVSGKYLDIEIIFTWKLIIIL